MGGGLFSCYNPIMKRGKLGIKMSGIFIFCIILVACMVFIPAWTFDYWQGWLFLGFLFIPMFFILLYMLKYERKLLEKRMKVKEKRGEQKYIQLINTLLFVLIMGVAGLDHRYGWSQMPVWSVIASDVLMFAGYMIFMRAMFHNEYASRVIEVQKGQRVVDTGPYAVVRHPMYASGILMYIFIPFALGSYWAEIPFLLLAVMLAFRLLDEEKALIKGLKGYKRYMKKVRYRLFPGVW
jgi:protein-S-isoprenylcysteine O-methyltransferase Ste14